MRASHSLPSLFLAFSFLSAAALADDGQQYPSYSASASQDAVVTVWVTSTITTCPWTPLSSALATGPGSKSAPGEYPTYSSVWNPTSGYTTYPGSSSSSYPGVTQSSPTASSSATSYSTSSASPPHASVCSDYWLEKIKHQGLAPFSSSPSTYQVFRNVKDYGAKGDGSTDDTDAINAAIADQGRCGPLTCQSTTTTPAIVYFPAGTYVISKPIVDFYLTQIVGNPDCLPVLQAAASFTDKWLIDGSLNNKWTSTNIFWRQVRNLVLDLTAVSPSLQVAAVHWPTGQATSLQNVVVKMSTAPGNKHQGVKIDDGSGGYLGDMIFYGGAQGLAVGNQQFTMRNLTFHGADTAIQQIWSWGWTYTGISINNCQVGLDISGTADDGTQPVGSVVFIDSKIVDTPVGIKTGKSATSTPPTANSLILENIWLSNVTKAAVQGPGESTLVAGTKGQTTIVAWGQGHAYGSTGKLPPLNGAFAPAVRPPGLTSGGSYYARSKPQYEGELVSQFVSVRDAGAKGDGVTDDSAALNAAIAAAAAAGKIVFIDYGVYLVKGTIKVPAGSRIVGESYPIIMSSGSFFSDISSPHPVVQVGTKGEFGVVEWSDTIVSTQGAQGGAILIEWNLASAPGSFSGLWDVHARVGGFAGSNLQLATCPKTPDVVVTAATVKQECIAAFMSMHITATATGLYLENVWLWVADHDVEDPNLSQISIYAGRGLLIESTAGDILLLGTAVEHHVLYAYQLANTHGIVAGQIQTETAYYQKNPGADVPFPAIAAYHDPVFAPGSHESGWGLRVLGSHDVNVYGAGLYSFFNNNNVSCSAAGNGEACQSHVLSVEGGSSAVTIYNLNTVGVTSLLTVDGNEVASYSDNLDGFVDTVAFIRV